MIKPNDPTPGASCLPKTPILSSQYETAAGPLKGLMPEFFADAKRGGVNTAVAEMTPTASSSLLAKVRILIVQPKTVSEPLFHVPPTTIFFLN